MLFEVIVSIAIAITSCEGLTRLHYMDFRGNLIHEISKISVILLLQQLHGYLLTCEVVGSIERPHINHCHRVGSQCSHDLKHEDVSPRPEPRQGEQENCRIVDTSALENIPPHTT